VDDDSLLVRLVERLYDAALRPRNWPRFLDCANRAFGSAVAAFAHYETRHQEHTINTCVGLSPSEIRAYEEHYSSRNVWVDRGGDRLLGGVVKGEELCPQPDLLRSEYYNDFLRRRGVGHVMAVAIRGNETQFTALSILRSERRGTFSQREVTLLAHVVPHLRRAVQIHERVAAVTPLAEPLTAVGELLSEGLIILGKDRRALYVNRTARAILDRASALVLGSDGLRLRSLAHDAQLERLLQSAAARPRLGATAGGGSLAVPRADPLPPLHLLATPAAGATRTDRGHSPVLLWLHDPGALPPPSHEWLRAAFGLSPAESRLACVLSEGATLKDASERLEVSSHTVRAQLKTALGKAGLHRQADLVRLARQGRRLGSPPDGRTQAAQA
jgi:DNA-binding CsgD family transcriptional regulator/PAS domain-containing protein